MKCNRGQETADHRRMKELIAKLFTLLGYLVFFEEQLTDVVAWKLRSGGPRIVGIEAERSPRNVLRNVRRDLARGCNVVLVVAANENLQAAIRRKLQRELPPEHLRKIAVTTITRTERAIERLETIHGNESQQL